jgi:uncharacterized protein (TIGR02186 family)
MTRTAHATDWIRTLPACRSRKRLVTALVALVVVAAAPPPALAERLVASLSNHRVQVSSNFTGENLVLFGSIEREPNNPQRRGGYDIIATVTGPRQNLVTYRKDRVLGIWVNVDSRVFDDVPAYFAVLANRPLAAIANAETLRRQQLGLANVVLLQRAAVTIADAASDDPFRVAFLKFKQQQQLYREATSDINFLTPTLYSASIPLPAVAPIGNYDIDVRLFVDGAPIARTNSALEVYKSGIEQVVTVSARDYSLLYGLAIVMMALVTGWFASVVFRRD